MLALTPVHFRDTLMWKHVFTKQQGLPWALPSFKALWRSASLHSRAAARTKKHQAGKRSSDSCLRLRVTKQFNSGTWLWYFTRLLLIPVSLLVVVTFSNPRACKIGSPGHWVFHSGYPNVTLSCPMGWNSEIKISPFIHIVQSLDWLSEGKIQSQKFLIVLICRSLHESEI